MTSRFEKVRARRAAEEYMQGMEVRAREMQLSDKALAAKWECSIESIKRVRQGQTVEVIDEFDHDLIRACMKERDRLAAQTAGLTKPALAHRHQVTTHAIDIELDLLGWVNPVRSGKRREVPA